MTKQMQKNEMAVLAHANHEGIVACKGVINRSFWELAYRLKLCRDEGYWSYLDYSSFEAYLGAPEVSISPGYASKLCRVYEWAQTYKIDREKIETLDCEKVYLLTHVKTTDEDRDEWIEKARLLSRSDLILSVHEAKTGEKEHEHSWTLFEVCSKCGMRRKVLQGKE